MSLKDLAGMLPDEPAPQRPQFNGASFGKFDVDSWLSRTGQSMSEPIAYQGGRKWILDECPFNPEHKKDAIVIQRADGTLQFTCLHNSCQQYSWSDFREKFEPGYRERRQTASVTNPVAQKQFNKVFKRELHTVCAADVLPESMSYLWEKRIPLGMVTMISGNPGGGKTFVAADIASGVTTGRAWPDGAKPAPIGSVLFINAEDSIANIIVPRLKRMGGDLSRVHIVKAVKAGPDSNEFSLATDNDLIYEHAEKVSDLKLIIIDPLASFIRADTNKSSDVRAILDPLKKLAEDTRAAVVLVNHLNKGSGSAIYRSMGSISIVGLTRMAWVIAEDRQDPSRRLMLNIKNNICESVDGLAFRITGEKDQGVIEWEKDSVTTTADEALAPTNNNNGGSGALETAEQWLRDLLTVNELPQTDIARFAKLEGISERTLYRAKSNIGAKAKKPHDHWVWYLPATEKPEFEAWEDLK